MKKNIILLAMIFSGFLMGFSQSSSTKASSTQGCKTFSKKDCKALSEMVLPNIEITLAEHVAPEMSKPDGMSALTGASSTPYELPCHCLIQGTIEKRTGADGKEYGTKFELRLPDEWQGRFIFQGGGGTDGFLAQAIGNIPVSQATAEPALNRGYAVVAMNGGHDGNGISAAFGYDQQARLDYAYAAIGKVTSTAKTMIKTYYNDDIDYSYFMGCSNGGREAMLAAQRYPLEFDGVVAGNPGFNLSRATMAQIWDIQVLSAIAPKDGQGRAILSEAFTDDELKLIRNIVLEQCDELDGIKDGVINDYLSCNVSPSSFRCKEGQTKNCLSLEKITAIEKLMTGPVNSQGEQLYSDWQLGTGLSAPTGWRRWKLGKSKDASNPDSFIQTLGVLSLIGYYMTPPIPKANFNPLDFDFDKDVARIKEMGGLNDALSTRLNTFEARGGKLLIYHGVSDPVFSVRDIKRWYDRVTNDTNDGNAEEHHAWNRLFLIPGMTHCGGGSGFSTFDPLAAIETWIEKDKAPDHLPATSVIFPNQEQPICPYPLTAQYNGTGDPKKIDSYICK